MSEGDSTYARVWAKSHLMAAVPRFECSLCGLPPTEPGWVAVTGPRHETAASTLHMCERADHLPHVALVVDWSLRPSERTLRGRLHEPPQHPHVIRADRLPAQAAQLPDRSGDLHLVLLAGRFWPEVALHRYARDGRRRFRDRDVITAAVSQGVTACDICS